MSERYSRLFALPENLYAVGSPVVIAAGTLLKDNQTGRIVAQLKFRSISDKIIKAVKVRLDLFDTAGSPIAESVVFDYLDLSVSRDAEFGQKTPVSVAESKARSYTVAVQEVVFADKTTWSAIDTPWESLPRQKTLNAVFSDSELVKQYRIALGSDCAYYPLDEKDIWYCTCGALNHADEGCNACHRTMFELQSIDLEQLAKDRDTRLAQEAADAEAKAAEEIAAAEEAKRKTAKVLKIAIPVLCAAVAVALLVTKVIIPNGQYNDAVALMEAGAYEKAIAAFEAMDGYKDSAAQILNCENAIVAAEQARIEAENSVEYEKAEALLTEGKRIEAAMAFGKIADYKDARIRSLELWGKAQGFTSIDVSGNGYVVALKTDGTVLAVGNNEMGACDVQEWKDIVSISAGAGFTVGLKIDGTVLAIGYNDNERLEVDDWKEVAAIATSMWSTIGIKADGTVVAAGIETVDKTDRLPLVNDWKNIVAVDGGENFVVGLKSDGTVVSEGYNGWAQCEVSDWKNITAICAGDLFTVGLKNDGTVVAVGRNVEGQCNVSDWTNIVAISAGKGHTVGLKADGTVVATGRNQRGQCNVGSWKNIVAIAAGASNTMGLKSDGTVIVIGWDEYGQCDASSWTNIKLP